MANQETKHDMDRKADPGPYVIPAEPLGAGAHPTVTPGCNANPAVKIRTLSPAEIAEATQTML